MNKVGGVPGDEKRGDKAKVDEQMGRMEEEKIKGMKQESGADKEERRGEARNDMTKNEARRQQMRGGEDTV